MDKLAQLRTEQGQIQEKIDALANSMESEKRGFTETEKTDLQTWSARLKEIENEAAPLQQLQEMRGKKIAPMPVTMAISTQSTEEQRTLEKYDLAKVVKSAMSGRKLEGLENDWMQEVNHRNKNAGSDIAGVAERGYAVPAELFSPAKSKRDYTVDGGTLGSEGGKTVQTDHMGLIDAIMPYMVLDKLGVKRQGGLRGDVDYPKEDSAPIATFATTETSAAASVAGTFSTVSGSPKRLPAYINYTMKMLAQSNISIENYTRERLIKSIAIAVQYNYFNGTATSGTPQGLIDYITDNSRWIETAGTLDWESMVDLEARVDIDNALDGSLAHVTNSYWKAALKTTKKDAGSGIFLLENGLLNEYPVHVTNHIPTSVSGAPTGTSYSPIIFGNFSTSKILQWGDVYFDMVNANAGSGYYQLVVNTFWDNVFTHEEAFSAIGDINLSAGFGS